MQIGDAQRAADVSRPSDQDCLHDAADGDRTVDATSLRTVDDLPHTRDRSGERRPPGVTSRGSAHAPDRTPTVHPD